MKMTNQLTLFIPFVEPTASETQQIRWLFVQGSDQILLIVVTVEMLLWLQLRRHSAPFLKTPIYHSDYNMSHQYKSVD